MTKKKKKKVFFNTNGKRHFFLKVDFIYNILDSSTKTTALEILGKIIKPIFH